MTLFRPPVLRIDRAELDGTTLVVRAVSPQVREDRRLGRTPLGYLYEQPDASAPETDLRFDAGHFDEAASVWSFSGEVLGMPGLTEPPSAASDPAPTEGAGA